MASYYQQEGSLLIKTANGFKLTGSISFQTANSLWQQSASLFAQFKDPFQIDLSAVVTLDSAGLALLVAWKKWAKNHKTTIYYVKPSKTLIALAEVNRVSSILELENH